MVRPFRTAMCALCRLHAVTRRHCIIAMFVELVSRGHMHLAGKTAQQDILPVLCPTAMNRRDHAAHHGAPARLMNSPTRSMRGAPSTLGRHGHCSMVWRRRVYRSSPAGKIVSTLFLNGSLDTIRCAIHSPAARHLFTSTCLSSHTLLCIPQMRSLHNLGLLRL